MKAFEAYYVTSFSHIHLKAIYTVVSVASEGKNCPKKGVEEQGNMTIRHRETAPRKKKEIATYNENLAKKRSCQLMRCKVTSNSNGSRLARFIL